MGDDHQRTRSFQVPFWHVQVVHQGLIVPGGIDVASIRDVVLDRNALECTRVAIAVSIAGSLTPKGPSEQGEKDERE